MSDPLLSIVTVNLNNLEGLENSLKSIFRQTWQDFELIVIDGGSIDGSKEFLEENEDKITYWISEPDTGIYNGMNKGIEKCTGNYVLFLNSGDYFLSTNTLELCFDLVCNYKADVYYGQIMIDDSGTEKTITFPNELRLSYLKSKVINHQACFFERKTLQSLGGYNEEFSLAADYQFYLKAYLEGKKFHPLLFPIVKYDVTGVSSVKMDNYRAEMDRIWTDTIPPVLFNLEADYFNLLASIKSSLILKLAFKIRNYKIKIFHGK